jgi:stage V sporulation protein AC
LLSVGADSKESSKPDFAWQFKTKFEQAKPGPPLIKNLLWAFSVGGLICTVGQVIQTFIIELGFGKQEAVAMTGGVMIFLGALFTGLGLYDELGKRAGAGSIVPITGFANSIVAPAMEFKREGYVFGIGAKMFVIAGPVIVYGTVTAVVVGFIYWMLH